jgi:hypothetical protein
MTTETETEVVNDTEGKLKKKKYFDGTVCAYKGCSKKAVGYISAIKPTKGHPVGQLFFAPSCAKCPEHKPMTLAELAHQRDGASDMALVLDVEVGDVKKRLKAAGIDETGKTLAASQFEKAMADDDNKVTTDDPPATAVPALLDTTALAVEDVAIPVATLAASIKETQDFLTVLDTFHIHNQSEMDTASIFLKEVKTKWKQIEEIRKEIGSPLRGKLQEVQDYFKPALEALVSAETILKTKISEGNARAQEAQRLALEAARTAHESGDPAATALATAQAQEADVALPGGISQSMKVKYAIEDLTLLPADFWSPDPKKVEAAIAAGHRQIPGVRIWEEPIIAARTA